MTAPRPTASPVGSRTSCCRICGAPSLEPVLDLGAQPLANSLVRREDLAQPEARYPLLLCRCARCGHVQLSVTVSPEIMFRVYPYVSGTSETLPRHFVDYARDIAERFLGGEGFVVEIGSNDGTLLRAFDRKRIKVLGVEPATNVAKIAEDAGIPTRNAFFGESLARAIRADEGPANAIIGNNVVAHIDDLHDLARAIDVLLAPDGVFVAEFPYLVDMLQGVEYDTIYHEHLNYFSVAAVADLFGRFGLTLFYVRRTSVHGGSIRIFVGRRRETERPLTELRSLEARLALAEGTPLAAFARSVERQRDELVAMVERFRREGRRLAGYGAAAKGNTLLNYCGIGERQLEFIADRSPLKQGLFTPGGHVPVRGPEALLEERPDYALLLAWNLADEIFRQQVDYRQAGGRFIVPIPRPHVL